MMNQAELYERLANIERRLKAIEAEIARDKLAKSNLEKVAQDVFDSMSYADMNDLDW